MQQIILIRNNEVIAKIVEPMHIWQQHSIKQSGRSGRFGTYVHVIGKDLLIGFDISNLHINTAKLASSHEMSFARKMYLL